MSTQTQEMKRLYDEVWEKAKKKVDKLKPRYYICLII